MTWILPLVSSSVSFIFAALVFYQYYQRRRPYQLLWGVGLLFYGISAGTELLAESSGTWTVPLLKVWYLVGAYFVAAYLGMGTVYLLAPRRIAHVVMAILAVASLAAVVVVVTAPDPTQMPPPGEPTGKVFEGYVRLGTPFFNIFGTVALVGGAVYSAWMFWRRRTRPRRMWANVLIAIGAIMPALGGTLLRFGISGFFYIGELLGAIIIFAGFLVSLEPRSAPVPAMGQTRKAGELRNLGAVKKPAGGKKGKKDKGRRR